MLFLLLLVQEEKLRFHFNFLQEFYNLNRGHQQKLKKEVFLNFLLKN